MIEHRVSVRSMRLLGLILVIASYGPSFTGWVLFSTALAIGVFYPLPVTVDKSSGRRITSVATFAALFGLLGFQLTRNSDWMLMLGVSAALGAWLQQSATRGRLPLGTSVFLTAIITAAPQQAQQAAAMEIDERLVVAAALVALAADQVDNFTVMTVQTDRFGDPRWPLRQPLHMAPLVIVSIVTVLALSVIGGRAIPEFEVLPSAVIEWNEGATGVGRQRSHPGLRGVLDAGDSAQLDDEIILRVRSEKPLYWRGITYDTYDGRYWRDLSENGSYVMPGSGFRISEDAPDPRSEEVVQTFTLEQSGLDVFLGADEISVLYYEDFEGTLSLQDRSIRPTEPLGAGAQWTVRSNILAITADELRQSGDLGRVPETILAAYAVEDDVSEATATLALAITENSPTIYDKVTALEDWFDRNVEYTRDVPDAPAGIDPVDRLLFDVRVGYCEQIATSMIVMLRSLGIPARMAVGYVPSEYDEATEEWISRGSDGHAWTEVYFPGIGWQAFDPTSGVPLAGEQVVVPTQQTEIPWVLLLAIIGAFGASAAGWHVVHRRLHRRKIDPVQHRLEQLGARLDLEWTGSRTLRDRFADLEQRGVDPGAISRTRATIETAGFAAPSVDQANQVGARHDLDRALNELSAAVESRRRELTSR